MIRGITVIKPYVKLGFAIPMKSLLHVTWIFLLELGLQECESGSLYYTSFWFELRNVYLG